MKARLISLPIVQLARLVGLVRRIEPVELEGSREWGLLVRGRGFTRILRDEPLVSPSLLRTADPHLPRPMCFPSSRGAVGYAQSVGLIPHQASWRVRES